MTTTTNERLLAPGERANFCEKTDTFDMGSTPPEKGGKTECGRRRINHKMKRHGPMSTTCTNPGCDACC